MSRPRGKVYRGAVYGVKAAVWKLPCLAWMGGPHEIILAPANPSSPVAAACAPKLLGYWYPLGLKVARSIAQGGREVLPCFGQHSGYCAESRGSGPCASLLSKAQAQALHCAWAALHCARAALIIIFGSFGHVQAAAFFFPAMLAMFRWLHFYYFRPFWPCSGGCIFIIFGRFGHAQAAAVLS